MRSNKIHKADLFTKKANEQYENQIKAKRKEVWQSSAKNKLDKTSKTTGNISAEVKEHAFRSWEELFFIRCHC